MAFDDLVIITGQSGVKVRDCIKRLDSEYVSIEDSISEVSGHKFMDFLGIPQALQYEHWSNAFKSIINKNVLSNSSCLTFHSVYYHQRKRELFSPIDLSLLEKHLKNKVKMVIVFIDDIYDVYKRLMAPNQMFEEVRNIELMDPLDAIYTSIFNIVSLLNWREMEISMSRSIANLLNTKLYIVSTKHPDFVVKRLLEHPLESLKMYYWSHPISAVRSVAKKYLAAFVGKLEVLSDRLLENKKTVLFFPTSIDELIIMQPESEKGEKFFVPKLDQRWSLPFEDKIIAPPLSPDLEKIEPLNPLNFPFKQDLSDPTTYAISHLLSLLWKILYLKQIISRDYSLVEQSLDGVIAWRPYSFGVRAGGVIGELAYNFSLMGKQKRRRTIIFSCPEDWNKFLINNLFTNLLPSYLVKKPDDLEESRLKWLQDNVMIEEKNFDAIIERLEKEVLPTDYNFGIKGKKGAWPGDSLANKQDQRKKGFEYIKRDLFFDEIEAELDGKNIKDRIDYFQYTNKNALFDEAVKFVENRIKEEETT